MEFPQRINKHIAESHSYKLFAKAIPNHWIIREVTERDYGIDCYIELVNTKNQLTGDLVSIQLKSTESINWQVNNSKTSKLYGINLSTTNYWYYFATPVFLFYIDLNTEDIYFTPIKATIRRNFFAYAKQEKFNYSINMTNKFNDEEGLKLFILHYIQERGRASFELITKHFLVNSQYFLDFADSHAQRDEFFGIENDDLVYITSVYENLRYIAHYLFIDWDIPELKELKEKSQKDFGSDYELHEGALAKLLEQLTARYEIIKKGLIDYITRIESEYWQIMDIHFFNYVLNLSFSDRYRVQ